MEKIRTAIDVKNAMDEGPEKLQCIGNCKQIYLEWKSETFGGGFEEEEDEFLNKIEKLKDELKGNYFHKFDLDEEYEIKINETQTSNKIKNKMLEELYLSAADSPYGDNKKLETVVDKDVRYAKEIKNIQVDPKLILKIEQEWSNHLYPVKVKVIPYKVNLYNSDGHFDEHLDTPEKDLVGTALVSLWDENNKNNSYLKLKDIQRERYENWSPDESSCIMFYSDCPHEVKSRYAWENKKDIRATLAFKVYSINEESNIDDFKINKVIKELENFDLKNKGFILEHGYSLETKALKGGDSILVSALEKMGYSLTLLPIMYNFTLESFHQDDDYYDCKVFPLRDIDIDYLLDLKPEKLTNYKDVEFYILDGKHYLWKDERQDFCEYTGNESQAENQNSIYISRALIIN